MTRRAWFDVAVVAVVVSLAWVPTLQARLRPEHRQALDEMGAAERAVGEVEAALRVGMEQCQRARAGLRNGRSGDTKKELDAVMDTVKEASRRTVAAGKALGKVDDGDFELEPTTRSAGP